MGIFRKRSFRKKDQYLDISFDKNKDNRNTDENDENAIPHGLTLSTNSSSSTENYTTITNNLSKNSSSPDDSRYSSSLNGDDSYNNDSNKHRIIKPLRSMKKNRSTTSTTISTPPPPRSGGQTSSELSSELQRRHQLHKQQQQQHNNNSTSEQTLPSPHQSSLQQQQQVTPAAPPTLHQIIHDLSTCDKTFSTPPSLALRHLFSSTSSNSTHEQSRIKLTRDADGQLIPTLLTFLQRCERGSSERYLTLLVLNNLSIPCENKRLVAVEYGGAGVLARGLCDDPGCHVVGIILANLCFSDANLRRQLVGADSRFGLVHALGYALRMALLPPQNTTNNKNNNNRSLNNDNISPRELLAEALEQDPPRQIPPNSSYDDNHENDYSYKDDYDDYSYNDDNDNDDDHDDDGHHNTDRGGNKCLNHRSLDYDHDSSNQHQHQPQSLQLQQQQQKQQQDSQNKNSQNYSFPETVRWCLCAIKSLTRPCREPFAAHSLLEAGILPLILEILYIPNAEHENDHHHTNNRRRRRRGGSSYGTRPQEWEPHSIQDSALYILVNLSITPSARDWLRSEDAVVTLGNIASYSAASRMGNYGGEEEEKEGMETEERQKGIQCLKARISLAFLLGSEGHFGQGRISPEAPKHINIPDDPTNNLLLTKGSEAPILVELISNSLHCRGKDGPGGYSASAFNAKKTLFAVRCLLTHNLNVKTFYVTCGVKLNALLFKSIALHAVQLAPVVDVEAAEDACFALYLLSNYGFMGPFLTEDSAGVDGTLFSKVLLSYLRKGSITDAGRHAAEQLLLRSPYLKFDGRLDDGDEPRGIQNSDFEFNDALLQAAEAVEGGTDEIMYGARPLDDVFGRPVMRQKVKNGGGGRAKASPSEDDSDVVAYPSALDAVQHLSFGSCVQHTSRIDDILIANNIANSANGGSGRPIELYGYYWKWQDDGLVFDRDIQQRLRELQAGNIDSVRGMISKVRQKKFMSSSEPLSIFGIKCGCSSNIVN